MPQNSFEQAQAHFKSVTERNPIGRTALLNSLQKLRDTGNEQMQASEIGVIRFASAMHGFLSTAIELETKPPLTYEQRSAMQTEIGSMEAITGANTDEGGAQAPTDTDGIDTAKKKA